MKKITDVAETLSGLRPDAVIIDDFIPLEQRVIQQLFERNIPTLDIVESFNKHRPDRPYGKKHRRKFK
ncbi:hypothetical protein RIVERRIDER_11 [Xanthomonas phage RiverRider]|uniref:Uncharacterized protein n=1 Tax=Xanthomonas phage RiverRider TaxID=2108116 RepID=A0A2P1JUU0_9CAUD|nr:hypothetical protein HWB58_gp11 [Xanthomonas phage RiverRider]AVO23099.1 hypothetical protein RIVERRIDER_11 [Xanthomonas phage RiverRider]